MDNTQIPPPSACLEAAPATVAEHVRRELLVLLAQVLRADVATLEADRSFLDYGMDSLLGIRFIHAINEAFGLQLSAISAFEHSSTAALADHITAEYGDALSATVLRQAREPGQIPPSGDHPGTGWMEQEI